MELISVMHDSSPEFNMCLEYWGKRGNRILGNYPGYWYVPQRNGVVLVSYGPIGTRYLPKAYVERFIHTEKETRPKMEKKYTITREQLKSIHDIACLEWKNKLKVMVQNDPFSIKLKLTEKQVEEMFKAATKEQLPLLKMIFVDYQPGIKLALHTQYISVSHDSTEFLLTSEYEWETRLTESGHLALKPKKK